MQKPSSVSVRLDRVVVSTAAHGLSATCIGMWQSFTFFRLGTIVAVPSVMVYSVKRHAPVSSAVDSSTSGVVGFLEAAALGNLDGHSAVQ